MRGFGNALQYSVFCCDLSDQEKICLKERLLDIIKADEDRILMVNLGPSDGHTEARFEVLGRQHAPEEGGAVIL